MGQISRGEESGYTLFGRDIMAIPCFRKCALTGLGASVGTTLLNFLFTSNGAQSAKIGYFTFLAVTVPYWYYCREQVYRQEADVKELQQRIKKRTEDEYIFLDSLEFGPETGG